MIVKLFIFFYLILSFSKGYGDHNLIVDDLSESISIDNCRSVDFSSEDLYENNENTSFKIICDISMNLINGVTIFVRDINDGLFRNSVDENLTPVDFFLKNSSLQFVDGQIHNVEALTETINISSLAQDLPITDVFQPVVTITPTVTDYYPQILEGVPQGSSLILTFGLDKNEYYDDFVDFYKGVYVNNIKVKMSAN